ncbi:MAG: ABC transporter ATP-binding protein [Acidobacteriia bacterium]|nr:ABC transporter ATP-binding protein [Terriglobia bacterium]
MSDIAIRAEGLGKLYKLGARERSRSLREALTDAFTAPFRRGRSSKKGSFWALRDISFEVKKGEVVGLIGRNGAGKSTLLKILSRITEPTTGQAEIHGRVASLLEVGTGFHAELTGRENIFLNGAILGMKKAEIRRKFDEIVAFSEVEKFIDTPVKHYSSGMYVRLAFGVAAHLEPEILIVDEVLAVGDAAFQKKCLRRMEQVSGEGRTVLFVSHNMAAVLQLTNRGILLEGGCLSLDGPTRQVVERYSETAEAVETFFDVEQKPRKYHGDGAVRILSLWFDRPIPLFAAHEDFEFGMKVRAMEEIPRLNVSMTVFKTDGVPVGSCWGPEFARVSAGETCEVKVTLPCPRLAPGRYCCGVSVGKGRLGFDYVSETLHFEVAPEEGDGGTISEWTSGWGAVRLPSLRASVSEEALPKV